MPNLSIAGQTLTPAITKLSDISYVYYTNAPDPIAIGLDVIAGEIYNVLSTRIGDEPWEFSYGSNLPLYAFAQFTPQVEQSAMLDVYNALRNFVPQVQLNLAGTSMFVNAQRRVLGIAVNVTYLGYASMIPVDLSGVY